MNFALGGSGSTLRSNEWLSLMAGWGRSIVGRYGGSGVGSWVALVWSGDVGPSAGTLGVGVPMVAVHVLRKPAASSTISTADQGIVSPVFESRSS